MKINILNKGYAILIEALLLSLGIMCLSKGEIYNNRMSFFLGLFYIVCTIIHRELTK